MNENNKTSLPAGFLFDQWSRYDAAARAIRAILPKGGSVLDVGCGEQMLLGAFLPEHELVYLDPLLAKHAGDNLIGKNLTPDVVPDGSYDIVVSVDALEHIPAASRQAFIEQLMRASRRGVVLAAPFADAGDAKSTDDHINATYRQKHGHDYSWLSEHGEFGLPNLAATCDQLTAAGFQITTFGNGHTPWLKDLLTTHILQLDEHSNVPVLREIGNRFAQDLLQFDHLEPTYRQVIVADRSTVPNIQLPVIDEPAAKQAWTAFRAWVDAQLSQHADKSTQALRDEAQHVAELQRQLERATTQIDALNKETRDFKQNAKSSKRRCDEANAKVRSVQQDMAGLKRSWSWRLSAPVRWFGSGVFAVATPIRAAIITVATWCIRIIPAGMRCPLKSAFFTLLKPLLQNSREFVEWQEAKRWRDRPAPPPALVIAAPHDTLPDVLVFGVIDWQLRFQRPQQLALELARRGHRVIYLSPSFKHERASGYAISKLAEDLPIYQVNLHTTGRASIYEGAPAPDLRDNLVLGMRQLFCDIGLHTNLSIVDHPGWVEIAKLVPRSQLIYDCMDNHHGFQESGSQLPADERQLIDASDAVVVTSNHIAAAVRPQHTQVPMIRNACTPDHFLAAATSAVANTRPVIGYFGAIAEWFDADLVHQVVSQMSDCDFLMVGEDTAKVQERLADLSNVRFVGEVEYDVLPNYVQSMDVLLIPFIIDQLTLATNPVKAYEALAAGKAVVATPMPELMDTDLAPFVRTGENSEEILTALRAALAERDDEQAQQRRIEFAKQQTWSHRVDDLISAAAKLPQPRVAVVVVAWNSVELTKRCVRSVIDDPLRPELDLIIVDNASTDATPAWLDEIETEPCVRIIRNPDNRGFSTACNQGLAAGAERDADMLVILNNDIAVTPGWATTLFRHMRNDASIGLIGPVTNNIGNEAKIDTAYENLDDMQPEQRSLTGRAAGRLFDIRVLAFFCVAMPRDVYQSIGPLDENFGTGFFEDDDYCQRVRQLERRIVCAEDVFVHHELSASFSKMPSKERQELFDRNKTYYESKWGPWQRHAYRPKGQDRNAAAS
jgi:O-antigen biosynthesis protein